MKLSKKVWVIVGSGILVVLIVVVFIVYFQQVKEQQELNEQLDAATVLSAKLEADEEDLENQLAQAESSLYASQKKFPQAVESIEFGEYLFVVADECNVSLTSLSFPKPTNEKVGAVTYPVVSLAIPVSGELTDIFDFIDVLRTDERFASTQVKSVNLNVFGGSAKISVDIYGYEG